MLRTDRVVEKKSLSTSKKKRWKRFHKRLLNALVENTPLHLCAFTAIQIIPALLLQKPSNTSKSKEHLQTLERRLQQWKKGEFIQLLREAETTQQRISSGLSRRDLAKSSRKFRNFMHKGNINGAIKLLTNNMRGGLLPLSEDTIKLFQSRHPRAEKS